MKLFKIAIFRPVATTMVFFALMVFGIYSTINLPIDLFPEIDPPVITVVATYQGAGALEVEQNVTRFLEDQFSTLTGLDQITSNSMDNISLITLEFDWGSNLDEASNNIRDALSRVRPLLPEDVEDPIIYRFNAASIPIVTLAATAEESFPNLRQILDNQLVAPLNRISGVGAVTIQGGPEREIQVNIDSERAAAYNIDFDQVAAALRNENVIIPAGNLRVGIEEFNVRVDAEFRTVEEIEQIVIRSGQDGIVYIRDVATVRDAVDDDQRLEILNGQNAVTISVQKQANANTVVVAREVLQAIPELARRLPPDVRIQTVVDTSRYIQNSISNLSEVLIFAVVFVVLIVFVFLRKWRATFIVGLSIPFSLIAAFIYLSVTGNTLNLISLSSLSIALGMVVDDAIVVLENISTYLEKGTKPREAALYGTNEVGVAVIATTLTVVAVFLPLTFLTGMTGIWFGQLGAIVVVTIVVSTLAALTLIPMMSSQLFKQKDMSNTNKRTTLGRRVSRTLENGFKSLDNGYKRVLGWALGHKLVVVVVAVLLFVVSLMLVPMVGTEFMPQADNAQMRIAIELPTGRSTQSAAPTIAKVENIFSEHVPELEIISSGVGSGAAAGGGAIMGGGSTASNVIDVTARLVPVDERTRNVFEIAEVIREQLKNLPEAMHFSVSTQGGATAGSPVAINVIGNDLDEINAIAERMVERLAQIEGVRNADISMGNPQPALQVNLDRNKMAPLGLTSASVGQSIRNRIAGLTATEFRERGEEFDIVIRYDEAYRSNIEDVRRIQVSTPDGRRVELSALGEIEEVLTPPNIDRIGRERALTVTADLMGTPLNVVHNQMNEFIAGLKIPTGIDIEFAGDIEEQQESFQDLFLLLGLSIILVYIVMAAQFESYKDPFIIMFSLPFAFTGVLLALVMTGTKLSVIAFVGGIILVGIVVKNAIVLVDYIQLLKGRGFSLFDAVVESGASRLRPVLMTTLTTLLAMTPLAFSRGEGSETWKPMAIAVIGGLTFSTVITLVFVPVMYAIFHRKKSYKAQLLS